MIINTLFKSSTILTVFMNTMRVHKRTMLSRTTVKSQPLSNKWAPHNADPMPPKPLVFAKPALLINEVVLEMQKAFLHKKISEHRLIPNLSNEKDSSVIHNEELRLSFKT